MTGFESNDKPAPWASLPGPWNEEPNRWSGQFHGLQCVAVRDSYFGNWCGYAGVSAEHPLYGVDYKDDVPAPDSWRERRLDPAELGTLNVFLAALGRALNGDMPGHAPLAMLLGAHHGLTFAGELRDFDGWFFGFDCGHAGDYQPGSIAAITHAEAESGVYLFPRRTTPEQRGEVYRTLEYTQLVCAHLADQLAHWGVEAAEVASAALKKAQSTP
jgi:hypothetical protein